MKDVHTTFQVFKVYFRIFCKLLIHWPSLSVLAYHEGCEGVERDEEEISICKRFCGEEEGSMMQ